ncbi:hypothetical protein [Actinocatenispora comari]|uniref:hypothetical protein n=1 Tax=Actinocatenispora comari TaxID=2807577 RepID=UPI001A936CDB|nr:hypothetical protein [Actinocatenispora comari]
MSYDLAVWEGDQPADGDAAQAAFERLAEAYLEFDGQGHAPRDRIRTYVEALVARHGDLADTASAPWAVGDLITEVHGPIVCLPITSAHAVAISADAARLASEMSLGCFDLQQGRTRSGIGKAGPTG